jgi:DNA-binding PadR family transcriptional regulator
LEDTGLIGFTERRRFPRFKKAYYLTEKGDRIMPYLIHLEKELSSCSGKGIGCISVMPKGCIPILIHMLNNPTSGVSRIIKELGISPSQVYLCLKYMVEKGVLSTEKRDASKRIVTTYRLSNEGYHAAIAADSLDRALKEL